MTRNAQRYKQLIYEDMHHIHRLSGLFIDGAEFKIDITTEPRGSDTVLKSSQVPRNIFINRKLKKADLDRLKDLVRFDLGDKYSTSMDYYVSLTPIAPSRPKMLRRQAGGYLFPLPNLATPCGAEPFEVTSFIVSYTEPAINYVEGLGAGSYDELVALHNTVGHSHFDDKIALLTPASYSSWRSILLMDHLNKNKYAHNGIGEAEVAEILSRTTIADYPMLQLIHGILHIYDAMYVYSEYSEPFYQHMKMAYQHVNIIADPHLRDCFFKLLNQHAGDCLKRTPTGEYSLPYNFTDEALDDKVRQYKHKCIKMGVILGPLHGQICNKDPSRTIDGTTKLPNT